MMVFGEGSAQCAVPLRNKLCAEELWFRRSPKRISYAAGRYLPITRAMGAASRWTFLPAPLSPQRPPLRHDQRLGWRVRKDARMSPRECLPGRLADRSAVIGIIGLGYVGYTFYLTWKAHQYGVHTRFIELAGEINRAMLPG